MYFLQNRIAATPVMVQAFDGESSWITAHRLLIPVFGVMRVRDMLEDMREICDQMICKWDGPDTIALCSMSYRLDSFASPPFVQTMVDFLRECNDRANRPWIIQMFINITDGKHQPDVEKMSKIAHSSTSIF
ncbi:hypothetical protein F5879DRAFT_357271 [Lentinula edodes]|nr:hypothetical protein F5879DRAFT_357271 [Lentinula edodes]